MTVWVRLSEPRSHRALKSFPPLADRDRSWHGWLILERRNLGKSGRQFKERRIERLFRELCHLVFEGSGDLFASAIRQDGDISRGRFQFQREAHRGCASPAHLNLVLADRTPCGDYRDRYSCARL